MPSLAKIRMNAKCHCRAALRSLIVRCTAKAVAPIAKQVRRIGKRGTADRKTICAMPENGPQRSGKWGTGIRKKGYAGSEKGVRGSGRRGTGDRKKGYERSEKRVRGVGKRDVRDRKEGCEGSEKGVRGIGKCPSDFGAAAYLRLERGYIAIAHPIFRPLSPHFRSLSADFRSLSPTFPPLSPAFRSLSARFSATCGEQTRRAATFCPLSTRPIVVYPTTPPASANKAPLSANFRAVSKTSSFACPP
jgi:hypothetical protein